MRLLLSILCSLFCLVSVVSQPPDCAFQNCCCGPEVVELGVPCGDFEAPPIANPIFVVFAGQSYCDWQVISGSIDLLSPNYSNWATGNPNGASQYIDLNGNEPGVIATTLTGMQAGHTYTLTFWYARNGNTPSASADVLIAGGAWLSESFTATNHGGDGWLEMCYSFVAQGGSAELRLIGTNPGASGVILDDFNLWGCAGPDNPAFVANEPEPFLQIHCNEPVPDVDDLILIHDCPGDVSIEFEEIQIPQPCLYNIRRHWSITPPCELEFEVEQMIEVRDTDAPVFIVPPQNMTVNCGDNILGEFYNWLAQLGNAEAADNCDNDLNWTTDFGIEPGELCGETYVTFTVTDICGNSVSADAVFSVVDDNPPVINSPAQDKFLYCLASPQDSIDLWLAQQGGAMAFDPCQPLDWSNDFNGDYWQEIITVTFTATDGCGNSASTTATVYQYNDSEIQYEFASTCDPLEAGLDTVIQFFGNCEIITITENNFVPSDTSYQVENICEAGHVGTDTLFLENMAGCDSLVITERILAAIDTTFLQSGSCNPQDTGLFVATLNGEYCDSVIVLEVLLLPSDTTFIQLFVCDPSQAGMDTILLTNNAGCDSMVVHIRTFSGIYVEQNTVQLCGVGISYSDTITVTGGVCDSLFVTHYTVYPVDTTEISGTTCKAGDAGLFTEILTNIHGCDSVVISNISLSPSDTLYLHEIVCDAVAAQNDTLYLSNSYGCDSLVYFIREYGGVDTLFTQSSSCDSALTGVTVTHLSGPNCDTVRVHTITWSPYNITQEYRISCEASGPAVDSLHFINQGGCDSLHLIFWSYSNLAFVAIPSPETCQNYKDGSIQVQVGGGIPPYEIRLQGGTWQSGMSFNNLAPGTYVVEVRDGHGCAQIHEPVDVGSGIAFNIDVGPDQQASQGQMIELSLHTSPLPESVAWVAQDPIACSSCLSTTLGPVTVTQSVQVTAWDQNGCEASAVFLLSLLEEDFPRVYIPTSFSPNFDGINDLFTIHANAQVQVINSMAIYDRWGTALYYREQIPVNDSSEGWDGTYRGKLMDPGVYVYAIEVLLVNGNTRLYKGDVTLIR